MARHTLRILAAGFCALILAGCGGGGGGSSLAGSSSSSGGGSSSSSGGATANSIPVIIDGGPKALTSQNQYAANVLYATVTVCTPGSTTACQTIDHVQVDTGSYGFSVIASVLNGSVTPTPTSVSGGPLRECLQYADGYTWGSIVTVDVTIGERKLSSLPMNLVGDPAAGTAPSDCSTTGTDKNLSTAAAFGSNGIIGIGYFAQDCGPDCATTAFSAGYYACPIQGCVSTTVPVAMQQQNPIAALSADNNGAVISLPQAATGGQATLSGTLYFGVGTEANNGVGTAQFLTVADLTSQTDSPGTLVTVFNGSSLSASVVDSGSNAYFFNDGNLTQCTSSSIGNGFYCTAASLSGTLQGVNGTQSTVDFSVGDADTLFATQTILTAFPTLAGPGASFGSVPLGFDWGLPFFIGRKVFVLFEGETVGTTTGPAVGF